MKFCVFPVCCSIFFSICKQLTNGLFGRSHILVEQFWAIDHLWVDNSASFLKPEIPMLSHALDNPTHTGTNTPTNIPNEHTKTHMHPQGRMQEKTHQQTIQIRQSRKIFYSEWEKRKQRGCKCGHGNEHERSWEGIPTLGSFVFNILPIWRAIRVFPVPGGPYSRIPLTCLMPNLRMVSGGYILEAKARRKVAASSWSRPPIPSFSKENSMRKGRMLGDRPVCVGVCDERERASNENMCRQNTHACRQHTHTYTGNTHMQATRTHASNTHTF